MRQLGILSTVDFHYKALLEPVTKHIVQS